jgi:hypothetical protein
LVCSSIKEIAVAEEKIDEMKRAERKKNLFIN